MQKLKTVISNNKHSITALFLTAVIVLAVYTIKGITPFSSGIVCGSDNYHQYSPFLAGTAEKIISGENLIYSTEFGFGGNFIGNIYNYLLSPFNLIIFITGSENVYLAMSIIVLLKCALAAFTFSYFLRKTSGISSVLSVTFGTAYALCGYFLSFCINVMWLDGLYMFPLLIYGLIKLVETQKGTVYTICLSYSIITCYYIGYMFCIASVIFFLYLYFSKHSIKEKVKTKKKEINRFLQTVLVFAIYTVLAIGMSAFVLLPQYLILKETPAMSGSLSAEDIVKWIVNPFEFLSRFSVFHEATLLHGDTPNIYCGGIAALLFPIMFLSKAFSKREKIASGGLFAVLFLSFSVSGLNLVWHAFNAPHGFAQRFSFIFSFFVLWLSYRTLTEINKVSTKAFTITAFVSAALVTVSLIISGTDVLLSLIGLFLFALMIGIIYIYKAKEAAKAFAVGVIVFLMAVESFIVASAHIPKYSTGDDTSAWQDAKTQIESEQSDQGRIAISDVSGEWWVPVNYPYQKGYKGVDAFSSVISSGLSKTIVALGNKGNRFNSFSYNQNTPYFSMFFDVRIMIERIGNVTSKPLGMSEVSKTENFVTYVSDYPTGIGYGTQNPLTNIEFSELPITYQSNWIKAAYGIDDLYTILYPSLSFTQENVILNVPENPDEDYSITPISSDEFSYSIAADITEDSHYYLEYTEANDFNLNIKILVNDNLMVEYGHNDTRPRVWDLGDLRKGDKIEIITSQDTDAVPTKTSFKLRFVSLDEYKMSEVYYAIKESGIAQRNKTQNDILSLSVDLNAKHFFISLPYDENFVIYVDGSQTEYYRAGESFIGLDLEQGHHEISIEYHQKGLTSGITISAVSLLLFIVFFVIMRKNNVKQCRIPS